MTFVRDLADAGSGLAEVGGKGQSLAALIKDGFDVPDGFHVVTAAYRAFVDDHGLREPMRRILADVVPDQPATATAASTEIAALFAARPMPAEIATVIEKAYAQLGRPPVAVRSSATAEDLPGLVRRPAGQLPQRPRQPTRCSTPSGLLGLAVDRPGDRLPGPAGQSAPTRLALAVVVQRLVDAEASGVMFTADPVTGATVRILIDAALGARRGGGRRRGHPGPSTGSTGAGTVLEASVAKKSIMTVRTDGGTEDGTGAGRGADGCRR